MATLTARMDDWLRDAIVDFWDDHGAGPSSALRRVAEEWWAMKEFPGIEFRDGAAGRRAHLRGGPDVWEVVMIARAYGDDADALRAHFGPAVTEDMLKEALAYADLFPDEIETWITENRRMERLLRETAGA